ncbi:MAG TPA: LysM peptidoglycan-binding domain-containing protein [Verrucomicrobiota bacterium]|nr:hypothetical protein [Verrucomicrobiales bacterium]HRI12568.1 LysM peptidoglycan-binding domain-containing protein [Verrucomicrobiota bacterium]
MNAKLIKLVIAAFKDSGYLRPTGEVYETLINPDSYNEQFEIDYSDAQPWGASGADLKYKGTKPRVIGFTFLFDGTGVVPMTSAGSAAAKVLPVTLQIEAFKRVALNFKGDTHAPRYVRIVWGTLVFKGRLSSLDISYTLFAPSGLPLRARAAAQFKGSISPLMRALQERTSSPDLTHVRVVKQGDTLPALSQEIYGDPAHYLELARVNRLSSFRRLQPGVQLIFPPIKR